MANYANLKSDIAGVIRTNNNEEITGDILQEQLFNMVDELGAGYQYMGIAIPTTNPGSPDANVFYIASTAGTYTNFGGAVVADGEVAILKYNGSWTKEVSGAATAAQVTQLGQELGPTTLSVTETGYYIRCDAGVGNSVGTRISHGQYCYIKAPCSAGDKVTLTGAGASQGRLWCFADSNDIILAVAAASTTATNLELTAPANTAYVIINSSIAGLGACTIETPGNITEQIAGINKKIDGATITIGSYDDLGVGYINVTDGVVSDTPLTGVGNYNNRRVRRADIEQFQQIRVTCKGDNTYLLYVIADSNRNVLWSKINNGGTAAQTFNVELPSGAKWVYFGDDKTNLIGSVVGTIIGLEPRMSAVEDTLAPFETITLNVSNMDNLGKGFINLVNGVVTDTPASGTNDRKVLKYDIGIYQNGVVTIHAKSDTGHPEYAITDIDGNVLLYYNATKSPHIYDTIEKLPAGSKYLYLSDDNANSMAYAIVQTIPTMADFYDLKYGEVDYSLYNLREEWFQVRVNSTRPVNDETDDINYSTDGEDYYYDNCYIGLPTNIKSGVKLIIICHGGGEPVGTDADSTHTFNRRCVGDTFRALGYAVLMTNGMPDAWATEQGLADSSVPVGNWMALESNIKAYQYVISKYPFIDRNGCYLWATSQGGMVAENLVELSDIPVKACAYQAPALSMRYVQLYLTSRLPWIQALYGFNSIATYSKEKCLGLDPFVRNLDEDIPIVGTTFAEIDQTDVDAITSKKFRRGIPLLILHGSADTAVSPTITKAYVKAINNAGGNIAKYKIFEGVGHGVASPKTSTFNGTTQYSGTGLTPTPLYTTAGILEFAKWYYRYGGYKIPSGAWGSGIE